MSASVGHGGNAFEKSGAAPPVVIPMPDDETHVGTDEKVKKDARFTKYAKGLNYFRIAKYLFFLLAMVGIIILALQVSKDQDTIQKLNHEMGDAPRIHDVALEEQIGGRMSYLDGFSGMTANDDDAVILMARGVMASDDPLAVTSTPLSTSVSITASTIAPSVAETASTETSCTSSSSSSSSDTDTTVNVLRTTTILSSASSVSVAEESVTTSGSTETTLHTQMTTTVLSNTTGTSVLSAAAVGTDIFSVDPLSGSIDSSMATLPVVSTSTTMTPPTTWTMSGLVPANPSHCLEFGDGAGPCNRPYGAPNTPPSSIVLSIQETATSSPTFGPPSLEPVPATSPLSPGGVTTSTSLDTGALSGTTTSTSGILSASETTTVPAMTSTTSTTSGTVSDMATSVCGPPTTVYVTLSVSTVTLASETGLTVASLSIGSGSDSTSTGPSTVTSTSTSLATTFTVSLASVTETILNSSATTTSGLVTATGFTLTLTHGNGTYSPTSTGPAPVATLSSSGGGGKAGGKPMGASGNGGTGNGMYCVVMLVSLLALLI